MAENTTTSTRTGTVRATYTGATTKTVAITQYIYLTYVITMIEPPKVIPVTPVTYKIEDNVLDTKVRTETGSLTSTASFGDWGEIGYTTPGMTLDSYKTGIVYSNDNTEGSAYTQQIGIKAKSGYRVQLSDGTNFPSGEQEKMILLQRAGGPELNFNYNDYGTNLYYLTSTNLQTLHVTVSLDGIEEVSSSDSYRIWFTGQLYSHTTYRPTSSLWEHPITETIQTLTGNTQTITCTKTTTGYNISIPALMNSIYTSNIKTFVAYEFAISTSNKKFIILQKVR